MNSNSAYSSVTLDYYAMWKVDVSTGVVSYPSTKKRYVAKDAILSGRASKSSIILKQSLR